MAQVDLDEEKLMELTGKVFENVSAAGSLLVAYIGDQAGVYSALEDHGPCSAGELSSKTKLDERYLLEWLSANAAMGYITYHEDSHQFSLTPEQAAIFAHEGEPTCMQGLFQGIVAQYATHDVALDVFKTGRGRPWEEHHECCFCGTDRFFRPIYVTNLLENWIPSLNGVQEKLEAGATVADIGCGLGSSSILMAKTFPNSKIYGYDFHEPSIIKAREKAEIEGVSNIEFAVSDAKNIPEKGYDFACIFDALHDMGDPVGVSKAILNTLNDDGTFMLVEPFANDELKDNLNTQSGLYYSFSTLICVPTSRAQEVGLQLGAQAGEKRLRSVLNEAGFNNIERRCLDIESNIVLEAKS